MTKLLLFLVALTLASTTLIGMVPAEKANEMNALSTINADINAEQLILWLIWAAKTNPEIIKKKNARFFLSNFKQLPALYNKETNRRAFLLARDVRNVLNSFNQLKKFITMADLNEAELVRVLEKIEARLKEIAANKIPDNEIVQKNLLKAPPAISKTFSMTQRLAARSHEQITREKRAIDSQKAIEQEIARVAAEKKRAEEQAKEQKKREDEAARLQEEQRKGAEAEELVRQKEEAEEIAERVREIEASHARTQAEEQAKEQKKKEATSSPLYLVGMWNSAKDKRCYMNAALQALYSMDQFKQAVIASADGFAKDSIAARLAEVFIKMENPDPNPEPLKAPCLNVGIIEEENASVCNLRALVGMQQGIEQDAGYFLTLIFNRFFEGNAITDKQKKEVLSKLIGLEIGQKEALNNEVVHIPELQFDKDNSIPHLLMDWLKTYPKESNIVSTGKYLILSIGRKQSDRAFPFALNDLNIKEVCVKSDSCPLYKLSAIIMHSPGHYTAYVRRGTQWYYVDDVMVLEVNNKEIERIAKEGQVSNRVVPTVLFYEAQQ